MDSLLLLKAAIMGVVEGLTEFLPISSTGHLILAGSLLGFDDAKAKVFDIAIQTGAIFAVILVYWQRIRDTVVALPTSAQARRFALNVLIGFFPAVLLGLLLGKAIKAHLFTPTIVASTFIIGGFIILWAERRHARKETAPRILSVDAMRWSDALKVGLVQCLAMIPGTSRSGATIIAALALGVDRRTAAEFSFILAIPTMIAATVYTLFKEWQQLDFQGFGLIAVGTLVAFAVALVVVRAVLALIGRIGWAPFGWYRIALGSVMLLVLMFRG